MTSLLRKPDWIPFSCIQCLSVIGEALKDEGQGLLYWLVASKFCADPFHFNLRVGCTTLFQICSGLPALPWVRHIIREYFWERGQTNVILIVCGQYTNRSLLRLWMNYWNQPIRMLRISLS
jgi:hypothetical protein